MLKGIFLGIQTAVSVALLIWINAVVGESHPIMPLVAVNAVITCVTAIYFAMEEVDLFK